MTATFPARHHPSASGAWLALLLLGCSGGGPLGKKGGDTGEATILEACNAECPDGTALASFASQEELVVSDAFLVIQGECQSFCEPTTPCVWPNLPAMVAGPEGPDFQCAPVEGFTDLPPVDEMDFSWAGVPDLPDPLVADSSLGLDPTWVLAGDVDGDADDDVILGYEQFIEALVSDGVGGFLPTVQDTGAAAILDAAAGQLNADDFVDLVVRVEDAYGEDRIRVYAGVGDGSFTVGPDLLVQGSIGRAVTLVDLDDDGHLDILSQGPAVGGVFVLWGDGLAGFSGPQLLTGACGFCNKTPLALRRTGSGRHDVVSEVGGWRNEGGRVFTEDAALVTGVDVEWGPNSYGAVDLDGDGLDGLALRDLYGLTWFPGDTFVGVPVFGVCADRVGTGDVDGDGLSEAVMGGGTCPGIGQVFLGESGPLTLLPDVGGVPVVGDFGPGLPRVVGVLP